MDYNRIYKARYMYTVDGVTDVKQIAEKTALSIEMASKAISDDMKYYSMVKADFAEDMAKDDFSRKYLVPKQVTLKAGKLEGPKERYFKLLRNGEITFDRIKSFLIADNVKDTQIAKILAELNQRLEEYKAGNFTRIAERLLQIEQLPPKWTVNKATGDLVTVYPAPLLDDNGNIYAVKYTRERIDWRKGLPLDLATALYELENPLYIDGQKLNPNPETWGEREYSILASKEREYGFYAELADYLGYTPEEFAVYVGRLQSHRKTTTRKENQEPVDFKKVAQKVAELMAEFKAKQHSTVIN